MMLFGLITIITDRASAQNACSKEVDGKKVNFKVVNNSDKPFVVNWVDHQCKEGSSNRHIAPGGSNDIFGINGHVYRVREVGTNNLLEEIVAAPTNPSQIIIGAVASNNVKANPPAGNQQSTAVMATKFPIPAGSALKKGVKYASPSGNHYLSLQDDGNLVVKTKNDGYIWGLDQVKKNFAARVELGRDGNLVAYDAQGKDIWSPQAKRDPNAKLNITPNGALQLVSGNGEILWSSDGNLAQEPSTTSGSAASKDIKVGKPTLLELVKDPDPMQGFLKTLNSVREARNLPVMEFDEALTKACQWHTDLMAKYDKMEHDAVVIGGNQFADMQHPWTRVKKFNYKGDGGTEAAGMVDTTDVSSIGGSAIMQWAMGSTHYRPFLSMDGQVFKHVGFGYTKTTKDPNRYYTCAVFGNPTP